MKTLLSIIILITGINLCSAQQTETKEKVNEKAIPQSVTGSFYKAHPHITPRFWFGTNIYYWYADYYPTWYGPWYGDWYWNNMVFPNQFMQVTYPEYYEVEFIDEEGNKSRALYHMNGQWQETRTKIKSLPSAIDSSLTASEYKEWKVGKHIEKIEILGQAGPVYRFRVYKGLNSHIVRYNQSGLLIQRKQRKEE